MPGQEGTHFHREAGEAAAAVRAQGERNADAVRRIGADLRAAPPRVVVTGARGSSDHAATFAKYLIETRAGIVTASSAPSVASVYGARQALEGALFIAISQSGRSPDLLAGAQTAKAAGARVLALVNDEESPLAALADDTIALCAGREQSVAASKSYIASLAALLHLVAEWTDDEVLRRALEETPALLARAWQLDWSGAMPVFVKAAHLYVIARGVGLGIAQEAALKFKETSDLHAEAFSSAEVRHGPQALLDPEMPVLVFAQDDETRPGLEVLARDLVARGVPVAMAGAQVPGAIALPALDAHPLVQPLLLVQAFYRMVNALALARGCDPDAPPHLSKVTETR